MKRIALGIETLEAAYDICRQVKDMTGNVIASGDFEPVDKENYAKAKKFMDAYERSITRGDWKKTLQQSVDKLTSLTNKLAS